MASALNRQVEGLRWMDKQTKAAAKEKVDYLQHDQGLLSMIYEYSNLIQSTVGTNGSFIT